MLFFFSFGNIIVGKIISSFVFLTKMFKLLVILFIMKLYARVNTLADEFSISFRNIDVI